MINLSRFSKIPFGDLVKLPNYYIHEIYKMYVNDSIARSKKEEEERRQQQIREQQERRISSVQGRRQDSENVRQLREALSGLGGMNQNDLEDLMEELE